MQGLIVVDSGVAAPPVFIPVDRAVPAPSVVITDIQVSGHNPEYLEISSELDEVSTSVGSLLVVTVDLRIGETVIPVTKNFRMPLRSVGSPTNDRLILVKFVDGVAVFTITLEHSRHWQITEDVINQSLKEEERMLFAGIDVYVLE